MTMIDGSGDRFTNGIACLTADLGSNCLYWPIELVLAFQVLASKSKITHANLL